MTLQIVGFGRSNFVRSIRMLAHEKGIAYEHVAVLPHSEEVKALHPLGLIPAIRHDGLELVETMAIGRYVDSVFPGPRLIPADPRQAARVDQWTSIAATSVDQVLMRQYVVQYLFNKDKDGNVVRTEIERAVKRMPRILGMLDKAVAPGHFGGADFSFADCVLAPILAAARSFPEAREALAGQARLSAYFDRVAARPSFAATAA